MVNVKIGEREWELKYTWPSLETTQRWLGKVWTDWNLTDPLVLRTALAGAMLHADRTMTPGKLENALSLSQLNELREAVGRAILLSIHGEEKVAELEKIAAGESTPTSGA